MARKTLICRVGALLFIGISFIGCANFDRVAMTELEPTKIEGGYQYFKYKVSTDIFRHLDKHGEDTRMKWLEESLAENGFPNAEYEILSRKPIFITKTLSKDAYNIYYEVKVKMQEFPEDSRKEAR